MNIRCAHVLDKLVAAAAGVLSATGAPLTATDLGRLRISQRPCQLNDMKQTCVITTAEGIEAMRIDVSSGDRPFWVFTPTGAATTDRRPYRDAQGRTWLFSGHRAFQLVEQSPDRNVISVESP